MIWAKNAENKIRDKVKVQEVIHCNYDNVAMGCMGVQFGQSSWVFCFGSRVGLTGKTAGVDWELRWWCSRTNFVNLDQQHRQPTMDWAGCSLAPKEADVEQMCLGSTEKQTEHWWMNYTRKRPNVLSTGQLAVAKTGKKSRSRKVEKSRKNMRDKVKYTLIYLY